MNTPILETKRLILRPITISDAEEIYTNWTSDPEVAKFMRWSTHPCVDATKEWLISVEQNLSSDTSYDWGFVRKSDNKLIGTGGLYFREDLDCFEIGYNLMKACWHQGYATEVAEAFVTFGTDTLNQTKFFGCHAKENPNSGKVMEKVGFQYFKDGTYESFDGTRRGETREYLLEIRK